MSDLSNLPTVHAQYMCAPSGVVASQLQLMQQQRRLRCPGGARSPHTSCNLPLATNDSDVGGCLGCGMWRSTSQSCPIPSRVPLTADNAVHTIICSRLCATLSTSAMPLASASAYWLAALLREKSGGGANKSGVVNAPLNISSSVASSSRSDLYRSAPCMYL
jgi:hypothetical protein